MGRSGRQPKGLSRQALQARSMCLHGHACHEAGRTATAGHKKAAWRAAVCRGLPHVKQAVMTKHGRLAVVHSAPETGRARRTGCLCPSGPLHAPSSKGAPPLAWACCSCWCCSSAAWSESVSRRCRSCAALHLCTALAREADSCVSWACRACGREAAASRGVGACAALRVACLGGGR